MNIHLCTYVQKTVCLSLFSVTNSKTTLLPIVTRNIKTEALFENSFRFKTLSRVGNTALFKPSITKCCEYYIKMQQHETHALKHLT